MKIYYTEGLSAVIETFETENILLSENVKDYLLVLLSKIGVYEEEEEKINPKILVGRNLGVIFKQIPDHFKVVVGEDSSEGIKIEKMLKALIPLCKNGWYVYVDVLESGIEYGIFRKFRSPVALDFEQLIFESKDLCLQEDFGLICIHPINKTTFIMKCAHGDDVIISFGFNQDINENTKENVGLLIEDITNSVDSGLATYSYVKNAMEHIFMALRERVHGAIALIVDSEYRYPNEYLSGLNINPPINIVDCVEETKQIGSYEAAERYYAIINLLYEFLNVDGITLINNKGEIIGYNAFYRSGKTPTDVVGGARKRTFEGLINQDDNGIIGVYYQSQDGNNKYVRR